MEEQPLTGAALRAKAAEEIARLKKELADWEAILGGPATTKTENAGPPLKRLVTHVKGLAVPKISEEDAVEFLKSEGIAEGYANSSIKQGLNYQRLKRDGKFLVLGKNADNEWPRHKR